MKQIIIVEPYAHLKHGHYRDKLTIWLTELKKLGVSTHLVTQQEVEGVTDLAVSVSTISRRSQKIASKLPTSISRIYMFVCCYVQGIELSKKLDCRLLGLTTRAALPIWIASKLKGVPPKPWGFHLMNCYLNGLMGKLQKIAFNSVTRRKCHVFANLQYNLEKLQPYMDVAYGSYLPDPIQVYNLNESVENSSAKLLVVGKDDNRRNGVAAVLDCVLPETINELHLHATGVKDDKTQSFKQVNPHVKISITEGFQSAEGFYRMFENVDVSLISYEPSFPMGSGNLVNSLVAGTPVVCTEISHAKHLDKEFPGIVEFFDYKSSDSLAEAIQKSISCSSEQAAIFNQQVRQLRNDVSAEVIVRNCMSKLGL